MNATAPSEEFPLFVLRRLQEAGHTAYWAGGSVRDRLMGCTPKDYDVATSARPDEVLELFPRSQKVGAAFGVILVRQRRRQVEVATFRADGDYSDGRHPDHVRFTNPQEDAKRRDFTCNGLFFDPISGTLHDFVGGQRDIDSRILRAIGDPSKRFAEDHLRMLRAIRFAARLDFSIEAATWSAIDLHQDKIATISRERIGEEMRMILESPARVRAMELLAMLPLMFKEIFSVEKIVDAPGGTGAEGGDWPTLAGLPATVNRVVGLTALLRDAGATDVKSIAGDLRAKLVLSNAETETLGWICDRLPQLERWEDLSKASLKRLMADPRWSDLAALYCANPVNSDQIFAFQERIESIRDEGVAPPPFVTGDVLIRMGARPGRGFKIWLDQLYDRQLNGELTTREAALAAARLLIV